ncbi:MAG TPA: hypothetical protein VG099_16350 [Gemmataceae bacterium]|jgi:hypothetical protein|nr:hypothetical protein [Gemmataceae bacterium]
MGLEARCICRFGKQTSEGKAHLDSDHLLFRGAFRLKVPFKDMKAIQADDGLLKIAMAEGAASFELGPAAPKWAEKILHPPQRLGKLGVKPGMCVVIMRVEEPAFHREVEKRQARVYPKPQKNADLIFLGAEEKGDLQRLSALPAFLKPGGAIWVVYPKGVTPITQADVMAAGKAAGLVDTKVASFSTTHTGLKLMIPIASRLSANG